MFSPSLALLVGFALSFTNVSVAFLCDASSAQQQSAYLATATRRVTTPAATPIATAGSPPNIWTTLAFIGVDNVGFKEKRQSSNSLKCQSTDLCLINQSEIPFCLNEQTGIWYGASGYSGSIRTNDYLTPNGQRGNLRDGPCPGNYYEADSRGGCAIVPASRRAAETFALSSASPTPAVTGALLTDTSVVASSRTASGTRTTQGSSTAAASATAESGAGRLTKRWTSVIICISGLLAII